MSNNPSTPFTGSNNVQYTPLQPQQTYGVGPPPSPGHDDDFHQAHELENLPPGAAQPRFLGASMYQEQGAPEVRNSFASSHHSFPAVNDPNSSVYALNPDPLSREQGFYGRYHDDPTQEFAASQQALPLSTVGQPRYLEEKRAAYAGPRAKSKRKAIILGSLGALILVVAGVGLGVYFAVFRKKSSGTPDPSTPTSSGKPSGALKTGGDGSQVTMEDGTKFTYKNPYGGYWYWDEDDPLNNGARPQSWSPPLNESFQLGSDVIRGVNLGGWLTLEPFISPAMFEKYLTRTPPAVDEWTLSEAMAADGSLERDMEEHYKTFITEKDFAEIAGAGLNYLRLPLPFWAIETRPGEPYLPKVAWKYFLKAIQWARKYGLRINLDLHAVPGSQNGWNHSGRLGTVNMLNGPMGLANAQRTLDYIRILAEFISQPQYSSVVTMFGITNEPQASVVGMENLSRFYYEAYKNVRTAGGIGTDKGPIISYHDGFAGADKWAGFLPNADRISLDLHPYLAFGPQSAAEMSTYRNTPCERWGASMNTSMGAFGLTAAGEFSLAVTDCGLWLNGVNLGTRYEGTFAGGFTRIGSCDRWTDWQNYTPQVKEDIRNFALASMDALQHWFFWTWKIGPSAATGKVETPAWSYQLGLENGYIPTDPRESTGMCGNTSPWQPPLQPWQTGGQGAGNIPAAAIASLSWPPPQISGGGAADQVPQYTPTGPIPTLPVPTFKGSVDAGSGWANAQDTVGAMVEIRGCNYLDPWVGAGAPPAPLCNGAAARREASPQPTTPPS